MKMVIAMLLAGFDLKSVGTANGGEPREHLAFTMSPEGLRMTLGPREADHGIDFATRATTMRAHLHNG